VVGMTTISKQKWLCSYVTDVTETVQTEFLLNPTKVTHMLATSVEVDLPSLVRIFDVIDYTQFSNLHHILVVTTFTLKTVMSLPL